MEVYKANSYSSLAKKWSYFKRLSFILFFYSIIGFTSYFISKIKSKGWGEKLIEKRIVLFNKPKFQDDSNHGDVGGGIEKYIFEGQGYNCKFWVSNRFNREDYKNEIITKQIQALNKSDTIDIKIRSIDSTSLKTSISEIRVFAIKKNEIDLFNASDLMMLEKEESRFSFYSSIVAFIIGVLIVSVEKFYYKK